MKGVAQALMLGFNIISCILCGFFLGRWLDQIMNLHPLFLILGLISGFVAAFLMLFKIVREGKDGTN